MIKLIILMIISSIIFTLANIQVIPKKENVYAVAPLPYQYP